MVLGCRRWFSTAMKPPDTSTKSTVHPCPLSAMAKKRVYSIAPLIAKGAPARRPGTSLEERL